MAHHQAQPLRPDHLEKREQPHQSQKGPEEDDREQKQMTRTEPTHPSRKREGEAKRMAHQLSGEQRREDCGQSILQKSIQLQKTHQQCQGIVSAVSKPSTRITLERTHDVHEPNRKPLKTQKTHDSPIVGSCASHLPQPTSTVLVQQNLHKKLKCPNNQEKSRANWQA